MLHLKTVHHFLHEKQQLMICLLMKQIILTLQWLCTISLNIVIIIRTHQEVFKRDKVPVTNDDLTIDNSQSFKYKSALVRKRADASNNTNSSVKDTNIVVPLKYLRNFIN